MFCANCGKELQGSGEFCSHCGSRVGAGQPSPAAPVRLGNMLPGMKILKGNELMFFFSVILLLISVFLIGEKMFKVSYTFIVTNTMEFSLFEEKDFLKMLFIVGYIGSAVIVLMPLFKGRDWERAHFAPGVVMQLLSAILFLITLFGAKGKMNSKDILQAVDASFALTANAWVFIVVTVGGMILSCKACSDVIFTQAYRNRLEMDKR